VVKAEVPEVKKEDIDVALEGGDLVIRGERKAEQEVKEEDYYRMERSYGSFYRRIPLGFEVKSEQVQAKYTDGVLEVSIPKPAETALQAQKIKVG
jgi:HSP20 family protein